MSFGEIDTEESTRSLSEVSSLDDDFDRMHLESGSSDEDQNPMQNSRKIMDLSKK